MCTAMRATASHLYRCCCSQDVKVFGGLPKQQISHSTADHIAVMTCATCLSDFHKVHWLHCILKQQGTTQACGRAENPTVENINPL